MIIALNRKAMHDFVVEQKIEAGIVLTGSEVKSIREHRVSFAGAFAIVKNLELWLLNLNVSIYAPANTLNHAPTRDRKLLVRKRQIMHLIGKVKTAGYTLIPLRLYTKHNLIKVEIGLCKGKTKVDKRDSEKEKDWMKQKARLMSRN